MKRYIASSAVVLLAAAIGLIAWGNSAPEVTNLTFGSEKLPAAFDGFRVVQISDLHDSQLGRNHSRLVDALKVAQPDIIVLTGDIVDAHRTNVERSLAFVRQAAQIAPTYYITGNHESGLSRQDYEALTDGLRACGVTILEGDAVSLERGGEAISLIGLKDIDWYVGMSMTERISAMQATLKRLLSENPGFSLVLSHRPELMDTYAATDADLVLSGHAHGGQFRLPFIGGLFAPGQGLFPEYDSGLYEKNGTALIVSRGIGNSSFPFRFNNRPEVVAVELKRLPPS